MQNIFYDGATGTYLLEKGINIYKNHATITNPQDVFAMHLQYINAGSSIILTNTFGVNREEYENFDEIIKKSIEIAKKAVINTEVKIAYNMTMINKVINSDFGINEYKKCIKEQIFLVKDEVDIIFIETITNLSELLLIIDEIRENTNIPIYATVFLNQNGKFCDGFDIKSAMKEINKREIQGFGLNCISSDEKMIEFAREIKKISKFPLIVAPNSKNTDEDLQKYVKTLSELKKIGASIFGGCCGTTPKHIKQAICNIL